jgi:pimeloyl-ACP methyl ester carboxylesterase
MDQTRFEELLRNFQAQCSAENSIVDLTATPGNFGGPIVVLVHGIGGNFRHWADPIGMNPNDTWLFDLNAHPPKETHGIGTSPPYKISAALSWTQFLSNNGITHINFSQSKPSDLLQYAVTELVAILSSLEKQVFEPYEQDVAANGGSVPPLIILGHSRGGLVTRASLKQLGSAGVPHLRKVITLCTPHQGSYMPRLASDYNNFLHNQMNFNILGNNLPGPIQHFVDNTIEKHLNDLANKVREAMLHSFGSLAQSAGFDELVPGSAMLNNLVVDEQPLPGVQYYGFGGSQPTFVNMYLCVMGQTIHLLSTSSPTLVGLIAKATPLDDHYDGLAELNKGDSAVALARSHWPDAFGAPHQDFHVNHMQALIDRPLQDAVLHIIQS